MAPNDEGMAPNDEVSLEAAQFDASENLMLEEKTVPFGTTDERCGSCLVWPCKCNVLVILKSIEEY